MRIPVIIQARIGSERLPAKVLRVVGGRPLIEYVVERLRKSNKISKIIIATSTNKEDQAICEYCEKKEIEFFRGSSNNVAKRFKDAIRKYGLESFIRISADSPLIDPNVVDEGIDIFGNGGYEIVTNTLKRTFPQGQSFEILSSDVFNKGFRNMTDERDLEHVTRYFYRNSSKFHIYNMEMDTDFSRINLCIDTQEDLDVFKRILEAMDRPFLDYSWREIAGIYKSIQEGIKA